MSKLEQVLEALSQLKLSKDVISRLRVQIRDDYFQAVALKDIMKANKILKDVIDNYKLRL